MRIPTPIEAKKMLTYINSRPDYDTWIKIVSAIGNTYDFNIALDILLSRFKDEKPNEHAKKLKNRLKNFKLATLIYYAKLNGYNSTSSVIHSTIIDDSYLNHSKIIDDSYSNHSENTDNSHLNQSKIVSFADINKTFYYRFTDDIEDRLDNMQYDGNISRIDAEKIILTQNPDIPRERAYRIALNDKVKDKTTDHKTLNEKFENHVLTVNEIANYICKGFAFISAKLEEDNEGKIQRKNKNWVCSELIALDIDTGFTINEVFNLPQTKYALLIYTTPSHTAEHHRFRILFALPYIEYNQHRYKEILESFIDIYKADKQCKDIARIYFGNSNGTIHILPTKEIRHYKNGIL